MIEWLTSYDDAIARAKAQDAFVLLDFYKPT